jgi:hypothetical protein
MKPVLYVLKIQNIRGKLPIVPVGDSETNPHHMHSVYSGAPGDRSLRPVLELFAGCGLKTHHPAGARTSAKWGLHS